MKIDRYIPTDILKPFIKTFTIMESEDGMVNRILPETSIVMGFRYKGATFAGEDHTSPLPAYAISGLTKSAHPLGYAPHSSALLITFTEGGAAAFSRGALHELFELHISLDNLVDRQKIEDVGEQLAEAKDNLQRFSIAEHFMLSKLRAKQFHSDPLIMDAVQTIKLANGSVRIKDLAASLFISQDHLEKRFRGAIGTSPKQFAKIVRLRNLIGKYSQPKSLMDAARAAGYFDQAHFIKDFKTFTGQTPKEFFRSPSFV